MIPGRLRLESFDAPGALPGGAAGAGPAPEVLAEEQRLAAYEQGYAAGWDDAVRAQADDAARLREDLAQNLRDLAFTFHEARIHVLRSLEPLLRAMADRVLPEVARAGFGAAVVAEAMAAARTAAGAPVDVLVAPASLAAVQAALGEDPALPVRLVADPLLAEGQARFRRPGEESALDLDALLAAIRSLVDDFLSQSQERQMHHG
ncbi:MAG: flagellar biosynthesis protein [Rhodobacteraceae bacterium]|nr:flagellar biosynthesis protein [Paracoccaceae bacterium]